MKRLINVMVIALFVFSVSLAVAGEPTSVKVQPNPQLQAKAKVNCCLKGQCGPVASAADCEKRGGRVVKDCKDCK